MYEKNWKYLCKYGWKNEKYEFDVKKLIIIGYICHFKVFMRL